jgi:hypothetical protein
MSPVFIKKLVLLNAVGAIVCATAVELGESLFGNALETVNGDIKYYESRAFGVIALIGALIWIIIFESGTL